MEKSRTKIKGIDGRGLEGWWWNGKKRD